MKKSFLVFVVALNIFSALSAQAECGGSTVGGTVVGTLGGIGVAKIVGARGLGGLILGGAGAIAGSQIQKQHNQADCEKQVPAGYRDGVPAVVPAAPSAGMFISSKGVQFKCYREAGPEGTVINVCISGQTVINVDSAYVNYTMECYAKNTYTKQISPSPKGSPFSQAELQNDAIGICRGMTNYGACVAVGCNYVN